MAVSYEFARRLEGRGITLNVAYPGSVLATNMRSQPSTAPFWLRLIRPLFNTTAEKAAHLSIYLASSPHVEGVTGQYFYQNSKSVKWPQPVYDVAVRTAIWEASERLTQLKPSLI